LNYPLYYLSTQRLSSIEQAMANLPERSIIVVEDIDTNVLTHSRDDKPPLLSNSKDSMPVELNNDSNESNGSDMKDLMAMSLSDVLNALDGIFYTHGRILIATTNHPEKLDSALIRPGRIDLKVEIGFVNTEILDQFIKSFYPDIEIDLTDFDIRDNISIAELQNMAMLGLSIDDILLFVRRHEHVTDCETKIMRGA